MLYRLAFAFVLAALIAPAVGAQRVQTEESTRLQLSRWTSDLQTAHQELVDGKVKKAERRIEKTQREMLKQLRGGAAAPLLFGQVSFLRALAAAKAGDIAAAKWDFQVALELGEAFRHLDMGPYGEAGLILEEARTERLERLQREAEHRTEDQHVFVTDEIITPPRKKYAPQPTYPLAHRLTCGEGKVVLQAIIDSEGRATQPAVVGSGDPILLFVAFDAVRDWRFEPARRNGEPVAVYYNLGVNFRIDVACVSPFGPLPKIDEGPPVG